MRARTSAWRSVQVCLFGLGTVLAAEDPVHVQRRERMVKWDIQMRGVRDERVLEAMRTVPRHEFVPSDLAGRAYADSPLPIGYGQTISQPFIVAAMTEMLEPEADDVVLEVGTGSGYQAAILSPLVRQVYTIEIIPELGERASGALHRLGFTNVTVRVGDGYQGWKEHAPFDGIIVTAAPDHVPPALEEQLKPGGRMVIPVGPVSAVQNLLLVHKDEDGVVTRRNTMAVRFVPLTGEAEEGLGER
jgi:protein-L-isoaspartate(D-aspartate) O-methyltransferase